MLGRHLTWVLGPCFYFHRGDAENLSKATPDAQFVIVKNMNHVLKTIEKDEDNLASYMSDIFPISEEFIIVITNFVLQK